MAASKCFWIYILYCNNDTYYTGYTIDLAKRFEQHLGGRASKYTRSFKPLHIAQYWKISGEKKRAMQIERYIKKLTRIEKENLIADPKSLYAGLRLNNQ